MVVIYRLILRESLKKTTNRGGFLTEPQVAPGGGYIPVSLLTKVGT